MVRYQLNCHETQVKSGLLVQGTTSWSLSAPQHVKDVFSGTYCTSQPQLNLVPSKFTFFPKLPSELRVMVWRHSMPGARIVELFWNEDTGICTSTCPPPITLSISREARSVALAYYKLCFQMGDAQPRIYFDMDIDELYLGIGNTTSSDDERLPLDCLIDTLASDDRVEVRYLSVDHDLLREDLSDQRRRER